MPGTTSQAAGSPRALAPPAWAAPVIAAACAALIALLRVTPSSDVDRGWFIGISAALNRGQKLYAEVYDNKDPLFFYADAVAYRLMGPIGLFVLEFLLLVAVAVIVCLIASRLGTGPGGSIAAGVFATAVLTAPPWFESGYSQLLGITLFFAALLAVVERQWLVAGLAAGLMLDARLAFVVMIPVLVVGLLCLCRGGRARAVGWMAIGTGVSVGMLVLVLAVRGELVGYVQAMRVNAGYPAGVLAWVPDLPGPPVGTLIRAGEQVRGSASGWAVLVLVIAALVALGVHLARRGWRAALAGRAGTAGAMAVAAVLGTFVLMAMSHVYVHHLQVLSVPVILAVIYLLVRWRDASVAWRPAVGAALAVPMFFGAGAPGLAQAATEVGDVPGRWSITDGDLQPALIAALPQRASRPTVAVVGFPIQGFPSAMPDGIGVSCRFFHGYSWYTAAMLREYLDCLARTPDVVATHVYLTPGPLWFQQEVPVLMQSVFTPVGSTQTGWTIWVRKRAGAGAARP